MSGLRRAAPVAVIVATAILLGVVAQFRFRAPDSRQFPVRGIDVSHHQGRIDWDRVAASGIDFAFIKATEGADHRDSRFERNWAEAHDAGVLRGAYHFFTFCTPGRPQALNFVAALPPGGASLPPAVDVEFSGNCTTWDIGGDIASIRRSLREFLGEVERITGRRPILYVTDESYRRIVRGHFDDWPLWVRSLFGEPNVAPESGWLVWQYADRGRLPGIDGVVDLNVFAGAPAALAELGAGGAP